MLIYFNLASEDYDQNTEMFTWPSKMGPVFAEGENILMRSRASNQEELKTRREKLLAELDIYAKQIDEYHSFGNYEELSKYLKTAQKLQARLDSIAERIVTFNHEEELFGWEPTRFGALTTTIDALAPFFSLYQTSVDFQRCYHSWMTGPFLKLDPEVVEAEVGSMRRNIFKLSLSFENDPAPSEIAELTKEQIERFQISLPLISTLCNPGLRERHWKDISQVVGFRFQPDESTSLSAGRISLDILACVRLLTCSIQVLERNLGEYMDQLEQISSVATKEYSFEKALQKMYSEWQAMEFGTVEYRDTGTHILSSVDEIQSLFDDHIVKTQTMRSSPFIKAFEEETRAWEERLLNMQVRSKCFALPSVDHTEVLVIQEIVDEWLKVQATWLYLEPIFSSEDIMRQMPAEGKRFVSVNKTWKDIMAFCVIDQHVLRVCAMPDLLEKVQSPWCLDVTAPGLLTFVLLVERK